MDSGVSLNNLLDVVHENRLVGRWSSLLGRCPGQVNQPHEADAELILLPGTSTFLAVTTDTVAEEIALGFYRDPETIGWMGATVSLSDLAAVGAGPLGLVASVTLPTGSDAGFQAGVARGLDAACRAAGTWVLGGDTNHAAQAGITTCAFGMVSCELVMMRARCRPGDLVYATGHLGDGSVAAARALIGLPDEMFAESDYRPRARIAEAQHLSSFAGCCMDTSDGLVATLDQLMRINRVGFELATPLEELLAPRTRDLCRQLGLPPLLLLAGHHGEFELVFTIPAAERQAFESSARSRGFAPLMIGHVVEKPEIRVGSNPGQAVDTTRIRNLLDEVHGDTGRYLRELSMLLA